MRVIKRWAFVLGVLTAVAGCGDDSNGSGGDGGSGAGGAGGAGATGGPGAGGMGGSGGAGGSGGEVGTECGDVICDPMAICAGQVGSTPTCRCPFGYLDPNGDGTLCEDRDECSLMTSNSLQPKGGGPRPGGNFSFCDENATCTNTLGSYACTCNSGYEDINGDGTRCEDINECDEATGSADCDTNATCLNLPGSFMCRCNCGFTGDGTSCTEGGCDCSETVTFTHSEGSEADEQDCITADVCLTRGLLRGLFNAATQVVNVSTDSRSDPEGTLWADSACDAAGATEDTRFDSFRDALDGNVGNNFDENTLCLWLTRSNLFYNVDITSWQSSGGGAFVYERTAAFGDECAHGDAVCGASCECPDGFENDPDTGVCAYPDPCDPSPCGAGASCLRTGLDTHVCQCDVTEFSKGIDEDVCDSISDGVCLARDENGPLFNSEVESDAGAAMDFCNSGIGEEPGPEPTGTEWTGGACADAAPGDFGPFVSDSLFRRCSVGNKVFEGPMCLNLTDGSDEQWDLLFTSWCSNGNGDCFSYIRSHNVADGESCD
ncbi:MAG: calcium-binding EGF-like domain-containing protein [Myxococcota bacterium]